MLNRIIQLVSLFFFGVAFWLIVKEVEYVGLSRLITLIINTPFWVLVVAFIFVVADYIVLMVYDVLALDYIRRKVPLKTVFKTSLVGFSVSNTAGHSYLSGGAVRYLFYTPIGISQSQILVIIAFETLTLFMGMGLVYVFATVCLPFVSELMETMHYALYFCISGLIVVAFLMYYFGVVVPKRKLKIKGVQLNAPSKMMTALQLLTGFADNFLLSLIFYSILRYHIDVDFLPVFVVFTLAQITAQVSQVPGGLGVFASLFLLMFPHLPAEKGAILATLFVYRILYFFIPFFVALFYLGFYEIKKRIYASRDE